MSESSVASELCRKYLRLHLCNGIGAVRFGALLREIGDIDRVLTAAPRELTRVKGISEKLAASVARDRDEAAVEREIALAGEHGVRIICLADDEYPIALKRIDDPPPCLYVKGTLQREDAIALGVVGSRHSSRYGAEQAERFGALLGGAGFTVASGMARGIDTAAHRGALSAGGRTIAVLGCGLCHLYPPESTELARRIAASGAILSELPMNIAPDSKNFPPRNRIIAGLSLGILVVEAARRSGALITARLANEYNREVFAIPGRIDMITAEGCNELIKTGGAKLVTKLEDVLQELGETGEALMPASSNPAGTKCQGSLPFDSKAVEGRPLVSLTPQEAHTLRILGPEALPIEAFCDGGELAPSQVAAALTGLQLKGMVRRVKGDLYERTGPGAAAPS
ncbi:MAG TPA: DNA-processing protein DprA [Phycisphaerae bacterium]|nr:DNA-processing protein DprA [Phycisphaerae bacterium]